MFYVFFKGFVLGLSIAALIGPIAMLCVKKTLDNGFVSGVSIGLGAATADGVYGSIAAFGLMTVTDFMMSYDYVLRFFGGLFLLYLGADAIISFFNNSNIKTAKIKSGNGFFKDFVATFFLTLTNPATIIIFMSIFAGLGITSYSQTYMSVLMVLGFFVGSLLFYITLSYFINFIGDKLSNDIINKISLLSGLVILGFGIFSLFSMLKFIK